MTDFASLLQPDRGQPAQLVHLLPADALDAWLAQQPERVRTTIAAAQFKAKPGEFVLLPGAKPQEWSAALGMPAAPGPWDLAPAAVKLPSGTYRIEGGPGAGALGWLLAHHRFDRYKQKPDPTAERILLTDDPARVDETVRMAEAVALVRDLVDTPSDDMAPPHLAAAVETIAKEFGATLTIVGGEPLAEQYPMVHAVGRAAAAPNGPRLIELEWGHPKHPRVAIVGKGVCFDSGGLDIKPAAGMRLMKKDMGGAAHALALARLVMQARLPVRLHLLIPAVENAIAGNAFRPGDVLISRNGLSVEIGNTDAEGRLILADALARAVEQQPALILDFATLTGAARVALGPELPALFANDDALAAELLAAGGITGDPLWRLPLWPGYRDLLKSDIADLTNAPEGGAGAITAALFLDRFVPTAIPWAHLDTFAWNPTAKPGRPKGGAALGLHAAWHLLAARFG